MKNHNKGYDFSPAVVALHFLLYRNCKNEEEKSECLAKFVWRPQEKFFLDLANKHPRQINCFYGPPRQFPKKTCGAICQNIYVANDLHQIAYLGTVFNHKAIIEDRQRMAEEAQNFLKHISETKIVRDICFCVIPLKTNIIDEMVIIESIKKFLESFKTSAKLSEIARLAQTTIALYSLKKGKFLDSEIKRQAKALMPDPSFCEKFLEKFS